MSPIEVDTLVIGAGVVGLAVANQCLNANPHQNLIVIERHPRFGQEASSRNSEVIHAGLYYRDLKSKEFHCLRGKNLLYAFCKEHAIAHLNCGKWIVASSSDQVEQLSALHANATRLNIPIEWHDRAGAQAALFSPSTGILNSEHFMQVLEAQAQSKGATFLYRHSLNAVLDRESQADVVSVLQPDNEPLYLRCRHVVNCAGLASASVKEKFSGNNDWTIRGCRGRYFKLSGRHQHKYQNLIYPIHDPRGGLGVHLTIDLEGHARLGPDVDWSMSQTHVADDAALLKFGPDDLSHVQEFYESGKKLIDDLLMDDLQADYIGVRSKLFFKGQAHPDFLIDLEANQRTLHLLGIESPGLTSALSLAQTVVEQLGQSV